MFAHDLARGLTRLGHEVTTTALRRSEDPTPLPALVLGPGRRHPRTMSTLVGALRAHDVAIAHGGPSLLPVAATAAVAGRPFLYRNIGDPAFWGDVSLADIRVGAPLRRAAGVVALYEGARSYLVQRYRLEPDRVTVASNAVDMTSFPRRNAATRRRAREALGVHEARPLLLYLGSLSQEKRPDAAVEVVASIDDAELLVAGAGPLRHPLQKTADQRAPGRVRFLGSWDRPAELLTAADVLLVPSRTEGVPGSLLEALAVGTPVVATAVGGVGEVIDALGGGLTVADRGDDTPALLQALVTATRSILRRPDAVTADVDAVAASHGLDAIAERYQAALIAAVSS